MLSDALITSYRKVLRWATVCPCVPHYFNQKTCKLQMHKGSRLYIVYFNNMISILFTFYLILQYFTAKELISSNRGMMLSLLTLAISVVGLGDLFILQNILLGSETLEFWNMTLQFCQSFRGKFKNLNGILKKFKCCKIICFAERYAKTQTISDDSKIARKLPLLLKIFPILGTAGTILSIFLPQFVCYLTSAMYVYNLSRSWFPFLVLLQYYIYLNYAFLMAEFIARHTIAAYSLLIIVKECENQVNSSRSFLTVSKLRHMESHGLKVMRCIYYIISRLNAIFGKFILPGFMVVKMLISICANCAAFTAKAKYPVLTVARKINLTIFSLLAISFIQAFCDFTGNISCSFNGTVKKWKLNARSAHNKKSFKAIPCVYIRAGMFIKIVKFTSVKMFKAISKHTAKLMINMTKGKH